MIAKWLNNPSSTTTQLTSKASSYTEEYLEANGKVESARSVTLHKWTVKLTVAWQSMKTRQSVGVAG